MDEKMRISNAEMKVMNQIWKAEEMVTVPEVLEILKKEGEEWTYPTVATFLRRLTAKEILGVTKKGNKLKNFLVAFRGSDKIGKNDMKDLRAWLDELDD